MQYRTSFLLEIGGTALITILEYASLALVFNRFGTLKGWSLGQVALLYGLAELSFGIMDLVFSGFDPGFFGLQVRRGSFDQLLLRPINITLQVLSAEFALRRLGKIIVGIAIIISALKLTEISWNPVKILLIISIIVSQILFFGGLFIIGSTVTFWTVESIEVINIFTYGGSYMISHPMHIFPKTLRQFFTYVIPAIFLSYFPALYIFDMPDPFNMPSWSPFLAPIIGIGMFLIAHRFWLYGIKQYQSTGT
jgi:ABC-2 type transport system permease protein